MALIQPFVFQHCTAFRERKQLADKTNEIINVLNDVDLENLPSEIDRIDQNVDNITDRIDQIEEDINKPWVLCSSDYKIYDYDTQTINNDTKIVYSLNFVCKPTFLDNQIRNLVRGTIYFNKGDAIDSRSPIISKIESNYSNVDEYNLIFADMNINLSIIEYGMSHDPYNFNVHGVCIDPINETMTHIISSLSINYQTDDISVSFNNPFINVYYKE